ncbi:MAG: peptidoglycan bridge formation glycyltransferase FemA/FemB family protein [Anaerolineae bacterium]
MQVVQQLDESRWRDFVDNHPQGNIFHTPEMFQVFSRARGYRPTLWAALDKDTQVLALLIPVQVSLKNGLLRPLTTRAVAYGSVLCDPSPAGQDALTILLDVYVQKVGREVLFTELRNLSDMSAVQPILNANGFVYEDHLNYLVNLDCPAQEVLERISRRTRKQIRRGLRKGEVVVEAATERSQVVACYELFQKTYRAARVPLADKSLFDAAFDILYPKGMIKFWLARMGENYVAASAELCYKDVIYGWYGGTDRDYGSYTPNELLMWRVLEWGTESGYRLYDFGGAGKPDEDYGVRDFKAKFGGQLVCFGRNTCVHASGRLKLSELGYQLYRRIV